MSISDHYKTGYTAIKNTEDNTGVVVTDTLSTDTSIGTSGVFSAHQREISGNELLKYASLQPDKMSRFYTAESGFTTNHWIKDLNGLYWQVVNVDNPHDLDEFYQIDAARGIKEIEQE